ncbi:tetratricopeptide repeat protein [Clostridium sp. D2Q-14]|uniref:tetratricopeptide repeat protein n=1 Tax=Anaeromonas gelatinilytica TaxID=2683194 RepID=UPI00193B80AD|nr:tetratricopeptide repeat protein [Anaeromonas gelatinilytica]MBS4534638.1 tetratricopeptide repeat protein [Anaeromonas gelatinilytica]
MKLNITRGKIVFLALLLIGIFVALFFRHRYENNKIDYLSSEESLEETQKYLEKYPDDVNGLMSLSLDYMNLKDYEQARDVLLKVLEIEPTSELAWHRLGISYEYLKEYDKVLEAYEKSFKLSKEDSASYYFLSQIYLLYDIEESVSMADKSLKIEKVNEVPNLEYTEEYVKFLKNINKDLKQKNNMEPYIELIESEYIASDPIKLGLIEKTLEELNEQDKENMEKLIDMKKEIEQRIY